MQSHQTVQIFYVLDIYRDRKGREVDARATNLISNASLAILARSKPTNSQEMKKCFDPYPPFIQKYESELCDVISSTLSDFEKTL
mmetsp:Transcript_59266/g.50201  ORF Transcript_59266/g.50201 Transcript_59266/m.50201 type:complete len:85 (-) Transcript_59266:974-1228(-)